MIRTLEEFSRRVDELKAQIDAHKQGASGPPAERQPMAQRVPQHPARHAGNAHQPAQSRAAT